MKAAIVVGDDDCSRKDGGLSSIVQRTRNISKKKICICSGCMVVSCCSNKHLKYLNREGTWDDYFWVFEYKCSFSKTKNNVMNSLLYHYCTLAL